VVTILSYPPFVTDRSDIANWSMPESSMIPSQELFARPFATMPEALAAHARERRNRRALVGSEAVLTYGELDELTGRIAAALRRDGAARFQSVAIVSANSVACAAAFLGSLRAGCVPTPVAPSSTPTQIAAMIADSGASMVFVDEEAAIALPSVAATSVRLDLLEDWLGPRSHPIPQEEAEPNDPFNIIYSSGTTGTPKGIVQSHAMRWAQIKRLQGSDFGEAVTLIATPLYSNTTLVSFLPTLAYGGTVVFLGKFNARRFLEVAAQQRATHAMLVPVQYQRIMADPEFDSFDLSAFKFKTCTSAPFSADLKSDIVRRWPGQLLEIYGMTEGGGTCLLYANQHPDKLHTVGQPAPGNDIRLIDEDGREVPQGMIGEVVGRSPAMMTGYHGRAQATAEAEWKDDEGNRFIRHGDLGRFDVDGFLSLLGRSKDLIISGGFNIYPPDIENVIIEHPAVADCAVIGVPSDAWGETPFAFYVPTGQGIGDVELVAWVNQQVGKTQRLSGAQTVSELPRSAIGKILKRELRELWRP
jgi:acyl-CoA synthetase (AMP-forming)/AMP-acid ligase II